MSCPPSCCGENESQKCCDKNGDNVYIRIPSCADESVNITANISRADNANKNMAYCKFSSCMTSNVNTLSPTLIQWDTVICNTNHFTVLNPTTIQIKNTGFYCINVLANCNITSAGQYRTALFIVKNSVNTKSSSAEGSVIGNGMLKQWTNSLTDFHELKKGDIINIAICRLGDAGVVTLLPGQTLLTICQMA